MNKENKNHNNQLKVLIKLSLNHKWLLKKIVAVLK